MKLRAAGWCQEDGDAEGGFVGVAVDAEAFVGVSGEWAFDCSGTDAEASAVHRLGQDRSAYGTDELDGAVLDDAGGLDELVAGGLEGDAETGPVWVGACAVGCVRDGDADGLVGAQEGVDLLSDPGPGPGSQDPPSEHRFLDLEVG